MLRQPPSPTGICVSERDTPVSDSQFLAHYSFVGRRQEPTQKKEQIHQNLVALCIPMFPRFLGVKAENSKSMEENMGRRRDQDSAILCFFP